MVYIPRDPLPDEEQEQYVNAHAQYVEQYDPNYFRQGEAERTKILSQFRRLLNFYWIYKQPLEHVQEYYEAHKKSLADYLARRASGAMAPEELDDFPRNLAYQQELERVTKALYDAKAAGPDTPFPFGFSEVSQVREQSFEERERLNREAREDYERRQEEQQAGNTARAAQDAAVLAARAAADAARAVQELAKQQEQQAKLFATLNDESKRVLAAAERAKSERIESEIAEQKDKLAALIKREQERATEKMQDILDPKRVTARQKAAEEAARARIAEALESIKEASKRGPLTDQDIADLKEAELTKYDQAIKDVIGPKDADAEAVLDKLAGSLEAIFGKETTFSEKTIKEIAKASSDAKIWTREQIEKQKEIHAEMQATDAAKYIEMIQKIQAGETP